MSEADLAVFEIDISRWPRMILSYHCYEAFKGIVDADWDDALIAAAVRQYPHWNIRSADGNAVIDADEFIDFSREFGGLTSWEAYATYRKNEFWNIRNDVQNFRGERD